MINNGHPRYHKLYLTSCKDPYENGEDFLGIILFNRDEYFRSHAIKHLANMLEFENSWKDITPLTPEDISKCVENLKMMGCPFYKNNILLDPPCLNKDMRRCELYDDCTKYVSHLKKAYFNSMIAVLSEGVEIPRYAFYSKKTGRDDSCHFWLIPDQKVVAKAERHGQFYNLTTCYGIQSSLCSWGEMRHQEREKLKEEARSAKHITWCVEQTWGTGSSQKENTFDRTDKKSKKKSHIKQPYFRQQGKGARHFLDHIDEY